MTRYWEKSQTEWHTDRSTDKEWFYKAYLGMGVQKLKNNNKKTTAFLLWGNEGA